MTRQKCAHRETRYVAEFEPVLGVMFRDYHKCLSCGAEYSIVSHKWSECPLPAPLHDPNTELRAGTRPDAGKAIPVEERSDDPTSSPCPKCRMTAVLCRCKNAAPLPRDEIAGLRATAERLQRAPVVTCQKCQRDVPYHDAFRCFQCQGWFDEACMAEHLRSTHNFGGNREYAAERYQQVLEGFTREDAAMLWGIAHHFQASTGDRAYTDRIASLAERVDAAASSLPAPLPAPAPETD